MAKYAFINFADYLEQTNTGIHHKFYMITLFSSACPIVQLFEGLSKLCLSKYLSEN